MATWLRQSTAVDVALGPFVDSTDGFTPETALSLTQAECRLKKNGGAWAQKNNATTAPHEEEGWYEVNFSTTDTDTLGILVLAVYVTGALPVWREFQVVTAAIWDAHFATGVQAVNVTQWLGTAAATPTVAGVPEVDITHYLGVTAPALIGGRYDASVGAMAPNVLTAAATAADFSVEVNAAILAVLGALADAAADGDPTSADTLMMYVKQLVNVLVGTAGVVTFPAAAVPANGVSLAEIIRQIYDEVAGLNGGALPAAAPTAAVVADAVWDEALAGHLTAGSTGEALNGAGAAGDPWLTALPGAYGAGSAGKIVGDNLNATVDSRATQVSVDALPLEGDVADAVWDEALAGHATAGSAGTTLGNLVNNVWAVSLTSITGAAARSPLNALRFLRNKWAVAGTTLTVMEEDDATPAWTATVTSDATAAPVVGNDPT